MIPIVGTMIGGYICFRCLEAICRNESQFSSHGHRTFIQVMAVIGIVVTTVLVIMLNGGSQTPTP